MLQQNALKGAILGIKKVDICIFFTLFNIFAHFTDYAVSPHQLVPLLLTQGSGQATFLEIRKRLCFILNKD